MTTAFAFFTMVNFGFDAEKTGYLLAYVGLLAAVSQGVIFGRLARRFGEASLAAVGSFMLALSLIAVPFISSKSGGIPALLLGTALRSWYLIGHDIQREPLAAKLHRAQARRDAGVETGTVVQHPCDRGGAARLPSRFVRRPIRGRLQHHA